MSTDAITSWSGTPADEQHDDRVAATLGHALADHLAAKVDAGARLYYALYHHPKAKELLTGDFATRELIEAYAEAGKAYRPRR